MHIYTSMQICKYASMHIYASLQVCKYARMQVCKYARLYKKLNKKKERGRFRDFQNSRRYYVSFQWMASSVVTFMMDFVVELMATILVVEALSGPLSCAGG